MIAQYEDGRPMLPPLSPREPRRGIQAFVWDAWPWMNWLLPVFFCFHGWLGSGGWETLALTVFSPVIVPVFGLLASLPRFILRKRGHTTAPGPMIWLLFVNWWSWFVAPLTIPGPTDGATIPSLLQSMIVVPLSDGFQGGMFIGCCVLGALAWAALIVLAGTLHPQPPLSGGRWRIISWISAFLIPLLFAVAVAIGVYATAGQLDEASETNAEANALPLQDQADRAEQRYEQTQVELAEVRALIADDGWQMLGGLSDLSYECRSLHMDCYFLDLQFVHETAGAGIDRNELVSQVETLGWKPTERDQLVDAEGRQLRLTISDAGSIRVEVETPWWWGDSFEIRRLLTDSGIRPGSYAADEWPRL